MRLVLREIFPSDYPFPMMHRESFGLHVFTVLNRFVFSPSRYIKKKCHETDKFMRDTIEASGVYANSCDTRVRA